MSLLNVMFDEFLKSYSLPDSLNYTFHDRLMGTVLLTKSLEGVLIIYLFALLSKHCVPVNCHDCVDIERPVWVSGIFSSFMGTHYMY